MQYSTGAPAPSSWTDLTTAHLLLGAGVVPALRAAAHKAITSASVSTIIEQDDPDRLSPASSTPASPSSRLAPPAASPGLAPHDTADPPSPLDLRKASVVSISTTISSSTEYIVSPTADRAPPGPPALAAPPFSFSPAAAACPPVPLARGLLLHAHVDRAAFGVAPDGPATSEAEMVRGYARRCVETARAHRGYVIGLVVRSDLPGMRGVMGVVSDEGDDDGAAPRDYLTILDVASDDETPESDAYPLDTSVRVGVAAIEGLHADMVCLGRNVVDAVDRRSVMEGLRRECWAGYCRRIGVGEEERV